MKKLLTSIEKLNRRFPGLLRKVMRWLDEGTSARQIKELLRERYGVSVPKSTVGYFRTHRWVPRREAIRERTLTALAHQEVLREKALRKALVASAVPPQGDKGPSADPREAGAKGGPSQREAKLEGDKVPGARA
jgi:hypothetical protein